MNYKFANRIGFTTIVVVVILFAVFPLTDTDIWWHLACAREWVTTWTPVREPVVNVHEFFQQSVAFIYNLGGATLLVAFKAVLWGIIFALFLWPLRRHLLIKMVPVIALILFVFRFHFEMRPIVFSLLFLGIYWNMLPWLFDKMKLNATLLFLLVLQWVWCKCQGLYILGPIFALLTLCAKIFVTRNQLQSVCTKKVALQIVFVFLLFAMPFMHREGWNLFLYPFGLLDRLLGTSPSAAIFASEIAENRSPLTLLMAGENVLESFLMILLCIVGLIFGVVSLYHFYAGRRSTIVDISKALWLIITAILALVAERNFVLFLPVFIAAFVSCSATRLYSNIFGSYRLCLQDDKAHLSAFTLRICGLSSLALLAFLLGLWGKSLLSFDSAIAYQRVPVAATEWMKTHPHQGRLFNDDRAGGYLAFMNPSDSIFIDGRFILKTAEFFERYLEYSKSPQLFLRDADSLNVDRVVLPLRYYARWDHLIAVLDASKNWNVMYRDSFFVVIDCIEFASKEY